MTFAELARALYDRGYTLADVAIDRMKSMIEDETGIWPDWDEPAPTWVVVACGVSPQMITG